MYLLKWPTRLLVINIDKRKYEVLSNIVDVYKKNQGAV